MATFNNIYTRSKLILFLVVILILLFISAGHAQAHGIEIESRVAEAVEIVARYDSGDPMAGAQVAIFAPDKPADPWLVGICDDEGRFLFIPAQDLPGTWEARVRLAGHGDLIRFEINQGKVSAPVKSTMSGLQKAVMAVAVIWGFIGTALFFNRRRI